MTKANRSGNRSQHNFAQIPRADIPRSRFDRSHGLKTSFKSGLLVPIYVDEALPGDTFNLRTSGFVRMVTPLYPLMDNLYVDYFFFAVPYRLVWDNWQKFNGEQNNPGDSVDYLVPVINSSGAPFQSTMDYMGIPPQPSLTFSSLHFRAYNLIWNEWFRDENLQDRAVVDTDDGPDDIADYFSVLPRGKRHDYFSSCLPWPQKGDAVELSLGSTAPVNPTGPAPTFTWSGAGGSGHNLQVGRSDRIGPGDVHPSSGSLDLSAHVISWSDPKLETDLSSATAQTINSIREAFQIQRLLERDARGGTRYTEIIRSHFGVVSDDQRLQRPEYLGGGMARVNVNPVANTALTGATDRETLGGLGGFATSQIDGVGFVKSFTEHCILIGMANVRADLTYQQGLNRMWSRQTRYDFYWPALSHLGEQAVLKKEIYADGSATDDEVFGYQERYAEYRYKPSYVSGFMRSDASPGPLDQWHLALDFASHPELNDDFIKDQPPVSRTLAVSESFEFFGDFYFQLHCARPMPVFSVPGMIDHF